MNYSSNGWTRQIVELYEKAKREKNDKQIKFFENSFPELVLPRDEPTEQLNVDASSLKNNYTDDYDWIYDGN